MEIFNFLTKKKKIIFSLFLFGFILKYNYFNMYILQTTSVLNLIIRNTIIILFFIILSPFLLENKKKIYISFFLYILFSSFFFANLWYNRYFGNYLSLADITMGQGIRPYKVLLRQLISWLDLLFILEFPFLIYLIFFKRDFKLTKISMIKKQSYKKQFVIIVLLITILIGAHSFHSENIYPKNDFLDLYQHSSSVFVDVYGILPLYAAEYFSNQNKDFKTKKLINQNQITGKKELSTENEIKDIKNIIVIQLESFDAKVIGYQHNLQELTPFLNSLKDESLYFDNIYAQHVNGSFDAEFSFLTSLYPINKNYAFKTNDLQEFNSLAKELKKKDYQILAFHNNKEEFFYRNKGYPELGFDKFYHREDFSTENAQIGTESYLGINDFDFLDQAVSYLKNEEKPFFAFFITVSSHTPFDFYPAKYKKEEFADLKDPIVRDYFNSIYFTDQSLKHFFEKLKDNKLYENTMFVFYADHSSDIRKKSYNSGDSFNISGTFKEPENIPLMIFHPELEKNSISKTGTHTDIAPTIFDLLGYSKKPEGFLGNSLLTKKENPILFLHETPQVLYKNNLFLRMPQSSEIDN
ncbi:MAG: LTA synthase family protein, partial [Bacillota bacterium]